MRRLVIATILASLGGVAAVADEPPTHPCAAVADPLQRLSCYDKTFPPRAAQARSTPPATKPPPLPAKEFGFTDAQLRQRESSDRKSESAQEIRATVSQLTRQRSGMFTVSLDNGQVWAQTELYSKARVRTGDAIVIRKAAFGSYLLVTPDGVGTRVKRVD